MRNKKMLLPVAAAFILSSVGLAPYGASAAPSLKHDAKIKNPVKSDAAMAKDLRKDAYKYERKAHKDAKAAAKKADAAAKKANTGARGAAQY